MEEDRPSFSDTQTDICESSVMSRANDQSISQIDENMPQQDRAHGDPLSFVAAASSSSIIPTTKQNTLRTASPIMQRYTLREYQSTSPVNGPGLAKPINAMSMIDPSGKTRIDAALEKNLETIVTQVRRTANKPSQLTHNDLQMFDSTSSNPMMKTSLHSREMTPDSITDEPTASFITSYGQLPWPPGVYPFAPQHPGLYLPYPPPPPIVAANSSLPPFYPPYDPQGLAAYYSQQAAAAARLFQEHSSVSDTFSSLLTTPTRSGEATPSIPSLLQNDHRAKKTSVHIPSASNHLAIHEQFSRLSPDLSSDGDGGAMNDADSIISVESQKSNTVNSMPVLEDGLSDSENLSSDEPSPAAVNSVVRRPTPNHHPAPATVPKPAPVKQPSSTRPSASVQPIKSSYHHHNDGPALSPDYDTDEETDKLLGLEHSLNARNQSIRDAVCDSTGRRNGPPRRREVQTRVIADPENSSVLIEGVLFRCRYLGSTQLMVDGNPTKVSRMMQAQEVVDRIKAPDGEHQPSVDVDLFISTEKIMVLNTDLEDILMDHSLRSISYIADIGDLVVLMAKRRYLQHDSNEDVSGNTATRRVVTFNQKMVCHVFESDEAQSIAHSIGEAFQVAYIEFLKANGIDDPSFTRDIDYQEVLEQQEMAVEELERFSKKECQKEAIVTKAKNEPLGIVIVESGWGSMLPTVVVANMMPGGPAARGGQLNIGDQIISVNGISLVGLPLSSCQTQIKNMKHLTTVRLLVVPCPPVVEVLIRRPDTKYQLGFSVQNGIICSLLRGGIAERGGVRVGHRIIEINGQSVVATSHERIVSMLSHSIGELRMKTMPTQMYRLLTGQETPIYI